MIGWRSWRLGFVSRFSLNSPTIPNNKAFFFFRHTQSPQVHPK